MGLMTLHASALLNFQNTVGMHATLHLIRTYSNSLQADVSKIIEVRDGAEGLTKEVLDAKLLS